MHHHAIIIIMLTSTYHIHYERLCEQMNVPQHALCLDLPERFSALGLDKNLTSLQQTHLDSFGIKAKTITKAPSSAKHKYQSTSCHLLTEEACLSVKNSFPRAAAVHRDHRAARIHCLSSKQIKI